MMAEPYHRIIMDDYAVRLDILPSIDPFVSFPSIPEERGAQLLASLWQLEKTQYASPENILEKQLSQLNRIVKHAYETTSFYRNHFDTHRFKLQRIDSLAKFQQIPLMNREQMQANQTGVRSKVVPEDHGPLAPVGTSGSTGRPLTLFSTEVMRKIWDGLNLRENLWHGRDLDKRQVAIIWQADDGPAQPPLGAITNNGWCNATSPFQRQGSGGILSIRTPIAQQLRWLQWMKPSYLLTYPSNAKALAEQAIEDGMALPDLQEVRTYGECIPDNLADLCQQAWDAKLVDYYGAREVGYIAFQCEHGSYHVAAENVLVEILDDQDTPCPPGQTGRVVLSSLNNYATPVLRYDIGDFASWAEPCRCGRTLPVISPVKGRLRNMAVKPDGQRFWPILGVNALAKETPMDQIQAVQLSPTEMEIRFVGERPMNQSDIDRATEILSKNLGVAYRFSFKRMQEIPRSSGNKFEEFICRPDVLQKVRGTS